MKNIFYALGLILLLSSCGGDDKLSDTIIGVWTLQTFVISDCPDATNNLPLVNADANGCIMVGTSSICSSFEFKSDGTMVSTNLEGGDTDIENFTYTVNDETNQVTVCQSGDCSSEVVTNGVITRVDINGGCNFIATYSK